MSEKLLALLLSHVSSQHGYGSTMIMHCALVAFAQQLENNKEALAIQFGQELFRTIEKMEDEVY